MSSVLLKNSTLIPRGVGHSLICPRRACTAKQVMVFRVFSPVNKAYNFNIWRLQSCVARRSLCHKVNLPRCEARRHRFIMTCDIFCTGQTNILGLCYSFGKTLYKQPTDTEINTLDQIAALIETDHTI